MPAPDNRRHRLERSLGEPPTWWGDRRRQSATSGWRQPTPASRETRLFQRQTAEQPDGFASRNAAWETNAEADQPERAGGQMRQTGGHSATPRYRTDGDPRLANVINPLLTAVRQTAARLTTNRQNSSGDDRPWACSMVRTSIVNSPRTAEPASRSPIVGNRKAAISGWLITPPGRDGRGCCAGLAGLNRRRHAGLGTDVRRCSPPGG